jgi:hypothetical protein
MTQQQQFVEDVRQRAGGEMSAGLTQFCDLILSMTEPQFIGCLGWMDEWERSRAA